MATLNYYETLQVSPKATQTEIKQAYRRLAKRFHPDSNSETSDHDLIVRLNAAYEILGDPNQRRHYDQQLQGPHRAAASRQQGTAPAQNRHRQHRQTGQDIDEQVRQWLNQVYKPVNQMLSRILNPLKAQIEQLSADPFDDELIEAFQTYLNSCRDFLKQAQLLFTSMRNPSPVAGAAAHLYYCLNQVGDGIEELEFFTLNYDDRYLHTGQELFRIAAGLRREAQVAIRDIKG